MISNLYQMKNYKQKNEELEKSHAQQKDNITFLELELQQKSTLAQEREAQVDSNEPSS